MLKKLAGVGRLLREERFVPVIIFVFTILLRAGVLAFLRRDPVFAMPIIDSLEFDIWACDILKGGFLWTSLQNHTPLYAYFLAAIYGIFGYSVFAVVLIQYLLAGASGILLYFIAKRITNRPAAILTACFAATYWFFIYVQSFLFSENLSLFLNLLLIAYLLYAGDGPKKFFLSGIILGLSIITRPDIAFFALFILAWLASRKPGFPKLLRWYLLFIAGIALIIFPVALRNLVVTGEFPVLRSQFGANLYMGNNPDFKGTSINVKLGKDWEDFISLPAKEAGRQVSESEADRFFVGRTLEIVRNRTLDWVRLMGGKLFSVLTGRDFLRSEDVFFYDNYIAPTPLRAVSTRMIFVLALTGILLSLREPKSFLLLYVFILSALFIIFFQIKTRYLIPVIPFFSVFSGYALYSLFCALRDKKVVYALSIILSLCFLSMVSLWNPLKIVNPGIAETYFAIANNYHSRGIYRPAVKYYYLAILLDPGDLSAYNQMGVVFMDLKDYPKALGLFEQALAIDKNALQPNLNYKLCKQLMAAKRQE